MLDSIPTHSLHQRRKVLIQAGEGAVLALVNSAVIGSLTSLKGVSRGEEEVAVRAIVSSAAIGRLSLIRWYFKREAALG